MLIGIAIATAVILWWIFAPQPKDRIYTMTERQQRMSSRLIELDMARVVLLAELGREPTPGELWNVSEPKEGE